MRTYMDGESALKAVPASRSLDRMPKSRECNEHIWFVVRFRIGPVTAPLTD